jgi:hypothetical protein
MAADGEAMITRKLHVVHDIPSATLAVSVCYLDDIQRPSALISSTDGPVAMEVHSQAKPTIRGWRTSARRVVTDYPAPGLLEYEVGVAQLARRAALAVTGWPDVALVVVEVASTRHEGMTGWLFPFVRPSEPHNADTPWTLDRSLVGLPCDRPVRE